MSNLIDGYGYLQSIATDMPQNIRDLAIQNRQSLLKTLDNPENNDHQISNSVMNKDYLEQQAKELEYLKDELQNITQQRIVLNISTREFIHDNKSNQKIPFQKSSQSFQTNRVKPLTILKNKSSKGNNENQSDQLEQDDSIPIESYKPALNLMPHYLTEAQQNQLQDYLNKHNVQNNPAGDNYHVKSVSSVGTKVMVPNVRLGSLPPELDNVVTTPVVISTSDKK